MYAIYVGGVYVLFSVVGQFQYEVLLAGNPLLVSYALSRSNATRVVVSSIANTSDDHAWSCCAISPRILTASPTLLGCRIAVVFGARMRVGEGCGLPLQNGNAPKVVIARAP